MKNQNRITEWASPNHIMHTGDGMKTYTDWLQSELERGSKRGWKLAIIKNKAGEIALARES